jgi:tRNA(fMet)-specific endonuclease VapC
MASYMLDTNVVIQIRAAHPRVSRRFGATRPGEAVMSVVSYGELLFGAEKSGARAKALALLERIMADIPVLNLPREAADHYAGIRFELSSKGEIIGPNDLWIAAHARAADLTLVTNNEREFRRVPDLRVENWASAA